MPARDVQRRLGGLLLLAASAVLAVGALPHVPPAVVTVGLALVGSAVAAFADLHLRLRRMGALLVLAVLVAIGDRLADSAVPLDRPWAVPLALGGYLVWNAASATPRIVLRAAPAAIIATVAPLLLRAGAPEAALAAAALVPVALVSAAIAIPRARAERARHAHAANRADVDAVVLANLELRNVPDAQDAAERIARIATELLDADGAVVWLRGPGRLLCAGGHGTTPAPDREITGGSALDDALRSGSVAADSGEIVVPLTGSGGVFGAVCVSSPRREVESFLTSVLQLFGAHAGYALERLRAVESLIDTRFVDPVTGVGNRHAAAASLATLRPGDAVLLLALDDLDAIRTCEGDAKADLVLGQLGLHLRTCTRAGDLVARFADDVFFLLLRDLGTGAEMVVTRLLESWQKTGTAGRVRAGAALHFTDSTPLDALDRAAEALDVARLDLDLDLRDDGALAS